MKFHYYYVAVCGYVLMYGNALAADNASSPDIASAFIRMVSVLAIIIGFILILTYIMRKINLPRKIIMGDSKCLEIVETLYLGPKKSIAVIKAGKEFVLISLTPTHVNFLTKIDIEVPSHEDTLGEKITVIPNKFASVLAAFDRRMSSTDPLYKHINVKSQQAASNKIVQFFQVPHIWANTLKRHL